MAALRVFIALVLLFAFLAGRNATTVSRADELTVGIDEPASPPGIDNYGNHVDRAVGDYRVDPRGDLYERHAPDTAVLKLGQPSV